MFPLRLLTFLLLQEFLQHGLLLSLPSPCCVELQHNSHKSFGTCSSYTEASSSDIQERKGKKKKKKKGVRFKQKSPQWEHKDTKEAWDAQAHKCHESMPKQTRLTFRVLGSEHHLNRRETLNAAPSRRLQRRQVAGGEASNHDNHSFFGTRQQRWLLSTQAL